MPTITHFEDLEIWQLAREQCNTFQRLQQQSGFSKDFALRDQMNRSSGSVMDCIAEGFERSGNAEFRNFLLMAKGSNGEFRSQLYRSLDRNYIEGPDFHAATRANEVLGGKIMSFYRYLQSSEYKGQRKFPGTK